MSDMPATMPSFPTPPAQPSLASTCVFKISTGEITAPDGSLIGTGYSGNGSFINDPTQCAAKDHGPLPTGLYWICPETDDPHTGPFSLPLIPSPTNEMWGRGDFLIHGGLPNEPDDSPSITPGSRTASDGCLVTARTVREQMAQYQFLQVVA
jgi:hypothetical protein